MEEIKFDEAQPLMHALRYCRESLEKIKDEKLSLSIKFNTSSGYCAFSPKHFKHFTVEESTQVQKLTKFFISLLLENRIKELEQKIIDI